jgi:hypothetical protein
MESGLVPGYVLYARFDKPTIFTSYNVVHMIEYNVTGRRTEPEEPKLKFQVHLIDLTSDDKQNMQLHPEHIPNPIASDRRLGEFHLPLGLRVVYDSSFTKLFVCQLMLFSAFKGSSRTKNSFLFLLIGTDIPFISSPFPEWMRP